ncbi:efflux RND transporter periplasmic adaptor subunit [Acinetobacter sp. ANC 4910]|uniref:efflux RND transporter periplasmic adaptor subunit n=1 Tax=Acinetobacter sp. ANC 4910 TaxID=2529850 RepID=UPI00104056F1|nr:efflux RND transporter periplasmic adaptor subunit [Acinetobacter sp. ANC 4910]TCB37431.1 efflux RND transporter periplasmic adaptor subunit [Acinetobacter sp. ANC 4910]
MQHVFRLFQSPALTICICLLLTACQKQPETPPTSENKKIELIQQDLVAFNYGQSVEKTSFTGSIRAVNQSSLQSQVTATATSVRADIGDAVQQGQILIQLNNQDNEARLAQAKANLAATKAQANLALNMMKRKQRLLDQGFISRVEFEQSQVDYQAQLENVNAQQATVNIALKAEQDGTLRSPITGIVTKRQVEPGQTVAAGQTLFEIVDPTRLELQVRLPSDQRNALKAGQKIEYRIQGSTEVLTATLSRISPLADLNSRQIEFYATPNSVLNPLSIGAFVEGNILAVPSASGQLIPLDTIQNIEQKPYVWVIHQQKIERIPIQILEQCYSENMAVVSGLANGDQISRVKFNDEDLHKTVTIQQNK